MTPKWIRIVVLSVAAAMAAQAADDVKPPVVKQRVEPKYTEEARAAKIQGPVLLKVKLNAQGGLESVSVEKSLGYGLDQSAIAAMIQWQWEPALNADGQAVPFTAIVEIDFKLL